MIVECFSGDFFIKIFSGRGLAPPLVELVGEEGGGSPHVPRCPDDPPLRGREVGSEEVFEDVEGSEGFNGGSLLHNNVLRPSDMHDKLFKGLRVLRDPW